MGKYKISINQLAEFPFSTEKGKRRLIAQQKRPNPFLVPWYQQAKSSIRKSFSSNNDLTSINEGIKKLVSKDINSQRQATDRKVSIEALEHFKNIDMPDILNRIDYTTIKYSKRSFNYLGVEIIVSPEIIFKGKLHGKTVVGGIKIHISKNKPFDFEKSSLVANTIFNYLKKVSNDDEHVLPTLCFSLDIFSERMVAADTSANSVSESIDSSIEEIKQLWDETMN